MNNLVNLLAFKTSAKCYLALLLLVSCFNIQAQDLDYKNGKTYTLGKITVSGNTSFSEQTIVAYSGLSKGKDIKIPGEDIRDAIKKLWKSNLFSDIEVFITNIEDDVATLEIHLSDLPQLNDLKINGVKNGKKEGIIEDNKLKRGVKVTENLLTTTKNYLTSKYKKDGFLNTKVHINTIDVKDSIQTSRVNMVLNIDKGEKVKIDDIIFSGDSVLSEKQLRKSMKNTKKKNPIRLLKRSKYIEEDYKEDLVSLIDTYKENGYRDARVLSDSIIIKSDKTVSLKINLEEGEKYTFGDITFIVTQYTLTNN